MKKPMRWWFALKQAWLECANLVQFIKDPNRQIHSLDEITLDKLDAGNIAILVLDFDGVLAGHDAIQPSPLVEQWLSTLSQTIGENRVAILSNKPKSKRLSYFAKKFPGIFVLKDVPKKPFPEGLRMIAQYKGVEPHRIVLVDDRLLTGMLATCLACTQGWYFTPPKTNYWQNPIRETFFSLLRIAERLCILALARARH